MINWQTKCVDSIKGSIKVPGDKSISHRAIMLGALAKGQTEIDGFLQGEDCIATRRAFETMGVGIYDEGEKIIINGVGIHGLEKPTTEICLGNSGTGMRLMTGILAGQKFNTTLIGDKSLMTRPMDRIANPLAEMGAKINTNNGCAPINIYPVKKLSSIEYQQPIASAQVKSSLLLAGLYAEGRLIIREPGVSRDHTERMLINFGYHVDSIKKANQVTTKIFGGGKLEAANISVPSDISSAAFFMVAGTIANNIESELTIKRVGINPTRTGIIDILRLMGANLIYKNKNELSAEPVADIVVRSSNLKGIYVPEELVPLAIDEFPIIFIAAACAEGEFILKNAKELRVKESDRISAMVKGLKTLGVNCRELPDGLIIRGNPKSPFPNKSIIDSLTDHRIAMAFAVAGIRADKGILIKNCDNVATSFPNFRLLAESIGMQVKDI